MNCTLKKLIHPTDDSISLAGYFDYCKSKLADAHYLPSLKQALFIKLGLSANAKGDGNTCMSQSAEVMPAYREHYSPEELFYYLLQKSQSMPEKVLGQWERLVPKSKEEFWKAVDRGRLLEEKSLMEKKSHPE